jgi:hypothetical protein
MDISVFDRATLQAVDPLHCPMCGISNAHILSVQIVQGPKVTTVTGEGTDEYVSRETYSFSGRGSLVAIRFFCEGCADCFEIVYQFHKGSVATGWRPIEVKAEPDDGYVPSELWRD